MKRMLAAGYDKLFQICRCWRESERGALHLPEFTMLEWYRTETSYMGLMDDCEELVRKAAFGIGLEESILFRGRIIDLGWKMGPDLG